MSLTILRDEGGTRDSETLEVPVLSRPVSSLCLTKLVAPEILPEDTDETIFVLDELLQTQADFLKCSQRTVGGGFFGGKRKEFTAYHVIANRTLTFYASDSKLDPLGSMALLDSSVAVETRESQLLLSLRSIGNPTVHVMEMTTGESKEWLEAFKRHGAKLRMPLLEDWMWKTGSKMTRWHKRKFVFFEDAIEYFKPDAEDKEMGSIPLIPGLAVKVLETVGNVGEGETPYTFCISYRTPAEERDYAINATSEAQRERWMNKIREITGQPPERKLRTSVMEGYLYKSTGRDSWQRMFAVLNDMDLAFYRTKYEGVPAFSIPLHATAEANPQDRGAVSTFLLWEKGDEGSKTHLIRCADDNSTLSWARAINYHCNSKLVKKHPESLKEGFLVLCPPPESSGIFEGQRRHFFVLVKNALMYYKKRDDTKPAGDIAMTGNAFVYMEQGINNGDKPSFSCAPSGDEGVKKTYLQAKDSAQRIEWVNAIVENVKTMRTKKVEDSVLEGYLFLTGLKISKRYFVLTQNSLDWYKKRADTTRQAGVDLLPESEAVFEDEEKGDFVFSVAASGDEGSKKSLISCYSESDQSKWVQAINDIIESKNVKLNPSSIKEGYLWKDNSSHNYNKRYFVLLADKMLYYGKRKEAAETGKEKGSIPLPGGTKLERLQEGSGSGKRGKVFPFNVEPCGDEGARVYALEACSTRARDLWLEAIASVLPKSSAVNSLSVLEGYLNKSDKNGKNWHKRYFVLWQDKLLYYKQKPVGDEDKKEAGRLEFNYDSSVSAEKDPKMPFMFQVSPAGDENSRRYLMQAEDEATMNKWVEVIGTLIAKRAQEKRDPDSLLEEFLWMSNGGASYRKRYCCLYPDRVVVYLNKFDKKETSSIELTANSFVAMQDSKVGIFYLGQDCLIRTGDAKKAEKWMVQILRLCSKMKKVPLFGGTLNDGCYLSTRRVPLLCYEIVVYLLPKVMEMTNLQSGNKEIVASIQQQYEEGKKVDLTQYGWQEALDVLVLYLKETGSKSYLIIPRVSTDLVTFLKPKTFLPEDFTAIRAVLNRLDENRLLLTRWILYFLSQIASSKNRISAELCAMRFTPVMLDCSSSSVPAPEPVLSPTSKKSPPAKTLSTPTHQDSPPLRTRHSFIGIGDAPTEAKMAPPPPSADTLGVEELLTPQGRLSRANSTVGGGRNDAATKMESLQRVLTALIEFYDELFPGGIPKTYRGRGQMLHHWTETRDENGKIVYFNTQTKQKQTELPGPFKRNAADWTFADLLVHKSGLDRMHAFAMNSHNAENLEFYLAVKTYRETEFKEKEAMVESAFALYRKFVDANAVSQVNISDKLRLPLDALLKSEEAFQKLSPEQQKDVFTAPQAEVYRLIETNEFRNFLKSQEFKDHLAALAETLT